MKRAMHRIIIWSLATAPGCIPWQIFLLYNKAAMAPLRMPLKSLMQRTGHLCGRRLILPNHFRLSFFPISNRLHDHAIQAKNAASANADGSPGSAKAVADAIENTMDTFFKGTDQYKNVTLADLVVVDNYYNNFPCVWAQYKDSIIYYLYGTDGTKAVFAGTLSLNKTGEVDITQPNGGYTCSFAPAVNPADTSKTDVDASKSVNLTYSSGLFLDDVTVDTPDIGLKGNFQLEKLFTNDPDNNTVIVVLTGIVNGMTCIGFDMPQPSDYTASNGHPGCLNKYAGGKILGHVDPSKESTRPDHIILDACRCHSAYPGNCLCDLRYLQDCQIKQQAKKPVSNEQIETVKAKLTEAQRAKIIRDYIRMADLKIPPTLTT